MSEFLEQIETALDGAKFHEDGAFMFAYPSKDGVSNESYRALVYSLRAYFWELWSVWDYILQNANAQTLREPQVDPRLIDRLGREMSSYDFLPLLQAMRDSPWRKRLARLRHSAHRWVLDPYQAEISGNQVTVISIRMPDGKEPFQVNIDLNDLWFMANCVNKLKDSGFFR